MALVLQTTDSIGDGTRLDLDPVDQFLLVPGVTIASTNGTAIRARGDGHNITVEGNIYAYAAGVDFGNGFDYSNSAITVGTKGSIISAVNNAIGMQGSDNSVVNHGELTGLTGVGFNNGSNNYLFNTGSITSSNYADPTPAAAVIFSNSLDGSNTFHNSGYVYSPYEFAFDSRSATSADTVINSGEMYGDVVLGGAADTFKGIGEGFVSGTVYGGTGADTLKGGALADSFVGGAGNDLLIGRGGDDTLIGNNGKDNLRGGRGDDTLNGGRLADVLNGGRDDDLLTGGGEADVFVFKRKAGDDTITDFEDGIDLIDLTAFGFKRSQFNSKVADGLSDAGNGATLLDLNQIGGQGTVIIEGLNLNDVSASDFLL